MEEKIYDRQVNKESLAARLFDEHQIERHFTSAELDQLYDVKDLNSETGNNTVSCPTDDLLLASVIQEHKSHVWSLHKHDNLLQNKLEEQLSKEDQDRAWACFNQTKQLQKVLPKRIQMKTFLSIFQRLPSHEVIDPTVDNTQQGSVVTCISKANHASDSVQYSGHKNGTKAVQSEDGRERHNECWQRDRKWKGTLQWNSESTVKNIPGCEVSFVRDTSVEIEDEDYLPELLSLTFTEKGFLKRPGKLPKFKTFVFHLDEQDELEKLLKNHVGTAYFKNKQNMDETLVLTLFKCGQRHILLGEYMPFREKHQKSESCVSPLSDPPWARVDDFSS